MFGLMRGPRSVVFGAGQRASLPRFAEKLGATVLFVTDERLEADPGFSALVDDLNARGLKVAVFSGVEAELPESCVAAGAEVARRKGADVVVGIGGGSCMDAAKFIALLHTHGGVPADYFGEFKVPGPILPLIAIPTTAGTGSEVTPVAVIADASRALKVGVASPHLIPTVAICDPELTYTCPPALTAISGADALTHAVEAFTTRGATATAQTAHDHVFVGKNALSDLYAIEAIARIGRSIERAVRDGNDHEARAEMLYGSMLAGLAFGAAGTSAAHAIQYPVGALTHTAHGVGVAVMLPYVMEFNRPYSTEAMARIALALGVAAPGNSSDDDARAAIKRVRDICAAIGIPRNLERLGLSAQQIGWTAEKALAATRLVKNNPRPLDQASMQSLIEAAFSGDSTTLATPPHS